MKVSEHFKVQEFVPKEIWDKFGEKSIWFIDEHLVSGMDIIRARLNRPITINNWHTGGRFGARGFRMPHSDVGAKLSQHKYGRAADFNVKGMTSDEVFDYIQSNWESLSMVRGFYFTTMENKKHTQGWTHMDLRWTGSNNLLIVNP